MRNYKEKGQKLTTFSKDVYLFLGSLSNHSLQTIPPGGMVSEADVCRSGFVPPLIGDDLHVVVLDDSKTDGGSSQVDAQSPGSLHLELDLVGDLGWKY